MRAGGARLAVPPDGQAGPPQRGPAADRQRRRLPRRLLRVRHPQGLPRLVVDHRHQGRAALAGLRARAALPLARRARRRVRRVGVPQGRQRRVHPGARPGRRVVRRRDRARVAGRRGDHEGRPGDRRRARGRDRVPRRRPWSARSTRGGRSSSWSTRASCRPTWSRRSAGSGSRAPRPRSTSPSTGCRGTRRCGDRGDQFRGFTNIGPSIDYLERAFDDAKYGWYSSRPYLDCADPVDDRPGHGAARQARHGSFVQYAPYQLRESDWDTERQNLGDTVQAHARVVLPGLRRPGPPPRGASRRSTSSGRSGCRRATSSPASSSRPRCSSSGRRRAGTSTAPRSTATTSAARAPIPAAA